MSAETLRRAARLMRQRAKAADADHPVWLADVHPLHDVSDDTFTQAASWHPAVTLAVAKAMDDVALAWELCDDGQSLDVDGDAIRFEDTVDGGWLNVARVYLAADDAAQPPARAATATPTQPDDDEERP